MSPLLPYGHPARLLFPTVQWVSSPRASLASASLLHTLWRFKYFLIFSLHLPWLNFAALSTGDTPCTTLINQSLLPFHLFVVWSLVCFCVCVMGWGQMGRWEKNLKHWGKMPSGCAPQSSLKVRRFPYSSINHKAGWGKAHHSASEGLYHSPSRCRGC